MIKEKDAEISMFIKQFETVKDDFGYNLKLLDARDDEIKRLSGLIMELKNKNHTMESDIQNMSSRIHSLLQHEKEMREKKLIETATNKVIQVSIVDVVSLYVVFQQLLKELSEEMESLRWTMNDEINAKNREVDQLRHDIKICQMQRDDALESQRLDLTNTFEGILTQRENEFHQIETQINSQVNDLEKKFESLTTENMKLKSDVSASARQMEGLTVEGQAKDDRCRSMQWQLKDFMQMAQSEQTELNSKIQQLQFVIDTLKDEKGQMSNAFEMDIAKVYINISDYIYMDNHMIM
jgi:chromosome segregation ATPase